MTVFHFAGTTLRDGTPLPEAGEELPSRDAVLCKSGWHGSIRAIDALVHAPGPYVALRELSGHIESDGEKACASHCRMLTGYADASDLLLEFAAWCAERAGHGSDAAGARAPGCGVAHTAIQWAAYARYAADARAYASAYAREADTGSAAASAHAALGSEIDAQEEWFSPRLRVLLGVAE